MFSYERGTPVVAARIAGWMSSAHACPGYRVQYRDTVHPIFYSTGTPELLYSDVLLDGDALFNAGYLALCRVLYRVPLFLSRTVQGALALPSRAVAPSRPPGVGAGNVQGYLAHKKQPPLPSTNTVHCDVKALLCEIPGFLKK